MEKRYKGLSINELEQVKKHGCPAGTQPGVPWEVSREGGWNVAGGLGTGCKMTPEVLVRIRGLENILRSLLQPIVGNRRPLKKFKQEVKSVLTFLSSSQVRPSSPSREELHRQLVFTSNHCLLNLHATCSPCCTSSIRKV